MLLCNHEMRCATDLELLHIYKVVYSCVDALIMIIISPKRLFECQILLADLCLIYLGPKGFFAYFKVTLAISSVMLKQDNKHETRQCIYAMYLCLLRLTQCPKKGMRSQIFSCSCHTLVMWT